MRPNFLACLRVIANDVFRLAPLLLGDQIRPGHGERAPGRPYFNAPPFLQWIRLPVVTEPQAMLSAIELRTAQRGPFRLHKCVGAHLSYGVGLHWFGLAALGKESIFGRFIPAPLKAKIKIPPN